MISYVDFSLSITVSLPHNHTTCPIETNQIPFTSIFLSYVAKLRAVILATRIRCANQCRHNSAKLLLRQGTQKEMV